MFVFISFLFLHSRLNQEMGLSKLLKIRQWHCLSLIALYCLYSYVYTSRSQHYAIALVAIFKNEEQTLSNWITHHLQQGFDHIFLIDNNSSDRSALIVKLFEQSGKVSYSYAPRQHQQMPHVINLIQRLNLKYKADWIAVCDLDEFFYGTSKKFSTSLRENFYAFDVVYVPWRMFGSSGLVEHPKDVRLENTFRRPEIDETTKYVFRPANVDISKLTIHKVQYPTKWKHLVTTDFDGKYIRMNHYRLQSLEYFKKVKMIRGDVSFSTSDSIRTMEYFNAWNSNMTAEDTFLKEIVLHPPQNYYI